MLRYVIHRLLIMVPTLLAISLITFVIIQLPPGDYLSSYMAELQAQGESIQGEKLEYLRGSTASTSPGGSSTWSGSAACSAAISATPSSTTCRSARWSATGCC